MNNLAETLAGLATTHVAAVLSEERDCRLIFPGLTESLALKLHEELKRQLGALGVTVPVYLALDYPGSKFNADEATGWLHYEALTSVRHGSFITVCMPKVLPKLHDSIRGSGSPIRGLTFADEWPWQDEGAEPFRFDGQVLEALLDKWSPDDEARRWLREITLKGLLPATAPLRDAVRVPLLLEDILDSFDVHLYPELDDVVDKFFFHCGIPRVISRANVSALDHVEVVARIAEALDEQRRRNPEFRDFLVNEVAVSTFAALDDLGGFQHALDLLLDGALALGVESGLLAFRGGLGPRSTSASVENWCSLDVDRLSKLLGVVGERERIRCAVSLPAGRGVVSAEGKYAAIFEGTPLQLDIEAEIGEDRFVAGDFCIRCKRRQRVLDERSCDEARVQTSVTIPASELPGNRSRINLVVQLVRFQQVVREARVYVHVCGDARPGLAIFEPGFEVVNLVQPDSNEPEPDSVALTCRDPVKVHILDWIATRTCQVLVNEERTQVDAVEESDDEGDGGIRYLVRDAVDVESFPGARADIRIEASGRECEVTLAGEDVEPGEFTLEDELRVATALSSSRRLRRVLPFFRGEGDLVLPKLGDLDAASRRRMDLARHFESASGWKPVLLDFLARCGRSSEEVCEGAYCKTSGTSPAFLRNAVPADAVKSAIMRYATCREAMLEVARQYVAGYATPSERSLYVVAPNYVARDLDAIEQAIADYLAAYSDVLSLLDAPALSPGELFTLVHLDTVVFEHGDAGDPELDMRVALLGPWHPLVVAKRFMVQHWLYLAAENDNPSTRQHRRFVSLFERVDGFRVVPGFDADGLGLDTSFAFPTSDPAWHVALTAGAFQALAGTPFGSLRGLGERLRWSLGLRSSLYLAGTELWSETFVNSFHRSHPSRRQLGLRVNGGLDARPIADSSARLLEERDGRTGTLGALLPGGIHVFLEERLEERQPLNWQHPMVFVYEGLSDYNCYAHFQPDILLLPQREDPRPTWLSGGAADGVPIPRGRGHGAAFYFPLVDLSSDRHGLPVSRLIENGGGDRGLGGSAGNVVGEDFLVGARFCKALQVIDKLAGRVRPQRPALVQELGLPESLRCDWTVLPGTLVDAGALATYIAGTGGEANEERALWDYRLDVGRSVSSYFIVCKVPKSVLATLAANALAPGVAGVSSALREIAEVGFAVGETMRSGKAAVGVLGVVGALRLVRKAWAAGGTHGRRWCTVLLPVDCFTDLLVPASVTAGTSKRTDLLAINLAWSTEGAPSLVLSPCAVECKYVSSVFPEGAVGDGLSQAEATYEVVRQLVACAQSETGMHARLALGHIIRFGLRLLAARSEVGLADEQVVLEAILSGSFEQTPPLAPALLVTTSCSATGPASIEKWSDGWWVRLTRDSWPREVLPLSDQVVYQIAEIFPAIEPVRADQSGNAGAAPPPVTSPPDDTVSPPGPRAPLAETASSTAEGTPISASDVGGPSRAPGKERGGTGDEMSLAQGISPAEGLVHPAFRSFVGNRAAVEALSIQLRYAEETGARAMRPVGLFGPKSTGKTELSRRVAEALGVPALFLSDTGLGDIDQLAERMQERAREAGHLMQVVGREGGQAILRCPPMLVFIDEVHQLSSRVQDSLLPVLEADDRTLRGSHVTIDARDVSFIIATTDWGKLREPFRSRVRAIRLEPYTTQEVAEMLRLRIQLVADSAEQSFVIDPEVTQLDEEALLAIATAARAVPRVALDLLREIGMALRIRLCDPSVENVWQHLQRMVPCDRHGLIPQDRKYLRILASRGPIGLDNIATELGIDRSNVAGAIEPFLVQMGWVQRVATGRTLTPEGRRFVARLGNAAR